MKFQQLIELAKLVLGLGISILLAANLALTWQVVKWLPMNQMASLETPNGEDEAKFKAPIVRPILPDTFRVEIVKSEPLNIQQPPERVVDVRILDSLKVLETKSVTYPR